MLHYTTYKESLQRALDTLLSNPEIFLIGEDIEEPYGGAFKITQNMSLRYPGKVINTPMSEQSFTGMGVGMALAGYKPIIEIMFGDFVTLALDQILNHASKFVEGFERNFHLVIRTPMGGYRGYGSTHSQSLEKIYLGLPNIAVIAPSVLQAPGELLINSLELGIPVLFIENKLDYSRKMFSNEKISSNFDIKLYEGKFPICEAKIVNEKPLLTIISYGGMVNPILNLIYDIYMEEEIPLRLLSLSELSPLKINQLADIVANDKQIVIIEEGHIPYGFGDGIVSNLSQLGINAQFKTIGAELSIIGASKEMETKTLPNFEKIKSFLVEFVKR